MAQAPYLFPIGSALGTDNLVLHARATRHRVENYTGPLSIKTVIAGRVSWVIRGRELVVNPQSMLVVAAGETYSMNIDAERPVETCCAFFASGFVERIAMDLTSPLADTMDGGTQLTPSVPYLTSLHQTDERTIATDVQALARKCRAELTPSSYEESFLTLAADLLHLYASIREQMNRVPARRCSTREELFRRLLIGREHLHSHQSGSVSLTQVARAAHLSPFHFHRGFTEAFGQTPHAYLTELRLSQARRMIEAGSPVLRACLEVGFSSPSAFSRLFRAHYGEPPLAVRRKFARSGKKQIENFHMLDA